MCCSGQRHSACTQRTAAAAHARDSGGKIVCGYLDGISVDGMGSAIGAVVVSGCGTVSALGTACELGTGVGMAGTARTIYA